MFPDSEGGRAPLQTDGARSWSLEGICPVAGEVGDMVENASKKQTTENIENQAAKSEIQRHTVH